MGGVFIMPRRPGCLSVILIQSRCYMKSLRSLFPDESDIPEEFCPPAPMERVGYLVDGRIHSWDGPVQRVESPVATRLGDTCSFRYLGACPDLGEDIGRAALDAANTAYDNGLGEWPTMVSEDRIACVEQFIGRLETMRSEVSLLLMWEVGKPYVEACGEFDRTIDYLRETVDVLRAMEIESSGLIDEQGFCARIRRAPLGPVLCMGPFNFPLNETFATLIPALLMGNTVILTPPRLGRLLFVPLMEALRDCFPPGVVNLVWGSNQLVRSILETGLVNVLAFIGSSDAADSLRRVHPAPNRLRCILGLGAKNAAIITESADLDLAVSESVSGSLAFSGQRCTALKILYVHESLADEFVRRFCEGVADMAVGMPWEEGVRITPLPEPDKTRYLSGLVADAQLHGARIANSGGGETASSLFRPAVLYPVNKDMRVYHEEQFGPVVPIVPFSDTEIPVRSVAESRYGQQVSVFGEDIDDIARLVDPLTNQVCRVNINCLCQRGPDSFPFTGRKDSAEGTLSVKDGLHRFSIRAMVAARESSGGRELLDRVAGTHSSNFLK